jgi:hypothetical protein
MIQRVPAFFPLTNEGFGEARAQPFFVYKTPLKYLLKLSLETAPPKS